jgi:hypothetical protein
MYQSMQQIIQSSGDFRSIQQAYWKYLGYIPPPPPAPPPPPPSPTYVPFIVDVDSSGLSAASVNAAIIASVVGGVVLLSVIIAAGVMYLHRRDRKRTLTGRIKPPPHGPDTTLCITDIQVCKCLDTCCGSLLA